MDLKQVGMLPPLLLWKLFHSQQCSSCPNTGSRCPTAQPARKSQPGTGKTAMTLKQHLCCHWKQRPHLLFPLLRQVVNKHCRELSARQGTGSTADFCIALCIGFRKKALGLRLVSALLALIGKHKQVLLKQQVEFSPGMFKQAFLEKKNPVHL